ncbi:MAG: inositol monophosphatase family protein [Ornithinimicrobium sp.]
MRAAYCGPQALDTATTGGMPTPEEAATFRELATRLALEAGRFIRDERPDHLGVAQTKATVLDVVTEMDTRCEDLLRQRLAHYRPDDAVLGEEDGMSTGSTGLTWVLDPIDGTVNYLYDIPAYSVSVAVVVGDPTSVGGWTPVAGAVFNPGVDEIFHAHAGGGARLEPAGTAPFPTARGLQVPMEVPLDKALVGTGFSYDTARRVQQAAVVAEMLPRVRDLRRMGSAALDLCAVGAGRLNAYYERGVQAWDMAAGALIAAEAGALVTGLDGPASPDMVACAPPDLHVELLDLLGHALSEHARSPAS